MKKAKRYEVLVPIQMTEVRRVRAYSKRQAIELAVRGHPVMARLLDRRHGWPAGNRGQPTSKPQVRELP